MQASVKWALLLAVLCVCAWAQPASARARRTLYEELGVAPTASQQQIRQAYRKLALQWHPDKNKDPAAEERFVNINKAYEQLSDADRRRDYDFELQSEAHGRRPRPPGFHGGMYTWRRPPPSHWQYAYSQPMHHDSLGGMWGAVADLLASPSGMLLAAVGVTVLVLALVQLIESSFAAVPQRPQPARGDAPAAGNPRMALLEHAAATHAPLLRRLTADVLRTRGKRVVVCSVSTSTQPARWRMLQSAAAQLQHDPLVFTWLCVEDEAHVQVLRDSVPALLRAMPVPQHDAVWCVQHAKRWARFDGGELTRDALLKWLLTVLAGQAEFSDGGPIAAG